MLCGELDVARRGEVAISLLRTDGFAAEDLAKYDVLIVEMWRGGACDEELRTVGIWACVGLRTVRSGKKEMIRGCGLRRTMESRNGFVCLTGKASSSNFSP